MRWIFRNWELKLGATGLATILYTGLVFSGSFTEARISGVPIQRINQPNGAYVITQDLGNIQVHYRQQSGVSAPVVVDRGTVPSGLELGTPSLSADKVDARGPRSLLNQVTAAQARVAIDASGIDFNQQVRLVPIDVR